MELVIIVPLLLFFVYCLFLNGFKVFMLLSANNVNYSEGMSIVRRPPDFGTTFDTKAGNYTLDRNTLDADLTDTAVLETFGAREGYELVWGGKIVKDSVSPYSSFWNKYLTRAGGSNEMLKSVIGYPSASFTTMFK